MERTEQVVKRKKLNLYRLPPKNFEGREDVIVFTDLQKVYSLEGRDEKVVALKSVSLSPKAEFYPIKRYHPIIPNPVF